MAEAQQIRASVYVPGDTKRPRFQRQITLDIICDWIRKQGLDDYTTQGLIRLAERYPTQALPNFRRNFNVMIQRVRQQRKQEQTQPIDERPTEIMEENTDGSNQSESQ